MPAEGTKHFTALPVLLSTGRQPFHFPGQDRQVCFKHIPYNLIGYRAHTHCMNTLSLVLPGIGIRNAEFAVYCNNEPVKRKHDIPGIFLVHGARLVPEHFLAKQGGELLNLCSPELLRQDEPVHVVPGTEPGLLRRQPEMFCYQHDICDKSVSELVCHGGILEGGSKKGGDGNKKGDREDQNP